MYFQLRLTALAEKQVEVELELLECEQIEFSYEEGDEEGKAEAHRLEILNEGERQLLEKKKEYLTNQVFECLESLPQDMQRMMGNMMEGMTPEMLKMTEAMEEKLRDMGLEHLDDQEDDDEEEKK